MLSSLQLLDLCSRSHIANHSSQGFTLWNWQRRRRSTIVDHGGRSTTTFTGSLGRVPCDDLLLHDVARRALDVLRNGFLDLRVGLCLGGFISHLLFVLLQVLPDLVLSFLRQLFDIHELTLHGLPPGRQITTFQRGIVSLGTDLILDLLEPLAEIARNRVAIPPTDSHQLPTGEVAEMHLTGTERRPPRAWELVRWECSGWL